MGNCIISRLIEAIVSISGSIALVGGVEYFTITMGIVWIYPSSWNISFSLDVVLTLSSRTFPNYCPSMWSNCQSDSYDLQRTGKRSLWEPEYANRTISQSNSVDTYPTMYHFVTEMYAHVHISVTKWCIVCYKLVHCRIYATGLRLLRFR